MDDWMNLKFTNSFNYETGVKTPVSPERGNSAGASLL